MNFTFIRKIFYFASLAIFLTSCNKDYFTVGSELFNGEFEDLNSIVFPVFSYQESTVKVATNNLPNVHLGKYNDDYYGALESSFVSQFDISYLPIFGDFSQQQEQEGSEIDIRVINEEEVLSAVYLDIPFFNIDNLRQRWKNIICDQKASYSLNYLDVLKDKISSRIEGLKKDFN